MSEAAEQRISDDRKVIQISGPLHEDLWEEKRRRQRKLRRTVAFDDIIRDWQHRAEVPSGT